MLRIWRKFSNNKVSSDEKFASLKVQFEQINIFLLIDKVFLREKHNLLKLNLLNLLYKEFNY